VTLLFNIAVSGSQHRITLHCRVCVWEYYEM